MPVQADNNGKLVGSFMVPAGVPVGTKRVRFQGSGGSSAETTYIAEGFLVNSVLQLVINRWIGVAVRRDPLAQTFTLTETRIVCAVDVKLTFRGNAANPLRCQLREVSLGVPTETILAEGEVSLANITPILPNTIGDWTRITFDTPAILLGDRDYALVLMTDDGYHAVAIATLGEYAKRAENTKEGWITSQPYTVGVLLSSSNNATWTPHQNSDLTFRLLAAKFTANTRTIDYGDIAFVNTSDVLIGAEVARPDGTTDATFRLTELTGGDVHNIQEFQAVQLTAKKNTNVSVECLLTGHGKLSPIVYPNPQAILGEMGLTADYVSRGFAAAVDFDAAVTFEVLKPSNANCIPYIEKQTMDGANPVINGEGEYVSEFVPLTKATAKLTGNGWIEERWVVSDLRGVGLDYTTRIKLVLTGTPANRVYVRNLRAVTK